jgi:hypothetical protein
MPADSRSSVNDRDEMPDAVPGRTPACRRLSARGRRPGSLKNVRNIKDNRAFPGFERDDVGEPPYDPRTAPVLNEPSVGLGVLQSFQRRVRETFPKDPDQRALSGASSSRGLSAEQQSLGEAAAGGLRSCIRRRRTGPPRRSRRTGSPRERSVTPEISPGCAESAPYLSRKRTGRFRRYSCKSFGSDFSYSDRQAPGQHVSGGRPTGRPEIARARYRVPAPLRLAHQSCRNQRTQPSPTGAT